MESRSQQTKIREFTENVIDKNYESLDDYISDEIGNCSTEGLYEMLEIIKWPPFVKVINDELKKRGELK